MRALYFGTFEQAGHHFHEPRYSPRQGRGRRTIRYDEAKALLPWDRVDGQLNPSEKEGEAELHHKDGWTALAFANRTDDSRPGCNAAFFFDAILTFDEAVIAAREHFPEVCRRFRFQIVPVRRAPSGRQTADAVGALIAERRGDPEFVARLREIVEQEFALSAVHGTDARGES